MRLVPYWGVPSRIPKALLAPDLKKLGENVRRERVRRRLTPEQLAERAELAVRTLQKIEAGKINVLTTTARRLRAALGYSWIELMD